MIVFETEHLLFRPLLPGDLDSLAKLNADPEVMRFIGGPRNKEEVRRALDSYIREYRFYGHAFFAIITKDGQDFIGHCRLLNQEMKRQGRDGTVLCTGENILATRVSSGRHTGAQRLWLTAAGLSTSNLSYSPR